MAKSLFEVEELESSIEKLKMDLLSRFYPFTKDQLLRFHSILNFDRYHLMNNENIEWDTELIEIFQEKIDWSAMWKLKNVTLDLEFFRKYHSRVDFYSIHLNKNISWSSQLLNEFASGFDWKKLILIDNLGSLENLRKYKDELDWVKVSRFIKLGINDGIINEFKDKWDWQKLSANKNLPISVEFVQQYNEKLDFNELSQNPKALELIYKHPESKRWNWNKIILNPAIIYDKTSFEFIFSHYKKNWFSKRNNNYHKPEHALGAFIYQLMGSIRSDTSYFLAEEFIQFMPWERFCSFSMLKLPIDFIENNKDQLNFEGSQFLKNHKDIITLEFIEANLNLFNKDNPELYKLPIRINILNNIMGNTNWGYLSNCETLDWSWQFIKDNSSSLNFFLLSQNQGVFCNLVGKSMTNFEILNFLELQLSEK